MTQLTRGLNAQKHYFYPTAMQTKNGINQFSDVKVLIKKLVFFLTICFHIINILWSQLVWKGVSYWDRVRGSASSRHWTRFKNSIFTRFWKTHMQSRTWKLKVFCTAQNFVRPSLEENCSADAIEYTINKFFLYARIKK